MWHSWCDPLAINQPAAAELTAFPGAAYTASKHGLLGLTKNTAAFYSTKNIRSVAILPGGMHTNIGDAMATGMNPEGWAVAEKSMAGELCDVNVTDVAQTVLFYAGPHAKGSNGATVAVDGGWLTF